MGHIEAGLRTGNIYAPWPEEMNRQLTDTICDKHFAPTESAKENLVKVGVPESSILVTGNTVIDALFYVSKRLETEDNLIKKTRKIVPDLQTGRKLILVTGHRRENFGQGFENICTALSTLAKRNDVQIIYPVHLNPNVQEPVNKILKGNDNIELIAPLDYLPFVYLMRESYMILTDSGGIQEEAPSLGKPVLVMRELTERPEAISAGTVKLVGANKETIVEETIRLLEDSDHYNLMSQSHNPYGSGNASNKILMELLRDK